MEISFTVRRGSDDQPLTFSFLAPAVQAALRRGLQAAAQRAQQRQAGEQPTAEGGTSLTAQTVFSAVTAGTAFLDGAATTMPPPTLADSCSVAAFSAASRFRALTSRALAAAAQAPPALRFTAHWRPLSTGMTRLQACRCGINSDAGRRYVR